MSNEQMPASDWTPAGHVFNWQAGYCACGWAGPAIDEVPRAHAAHVAEVTTPPDSTSSTETSDG